MICCDNLGDTIQSHNPVFHSRMKHLALDYHFEIEQDRAKTLTVRHVPSRGNKILSICQLIRLIIITLTDFCTAWIMVALNPSTETEPDMEI